VVGVALVVLAADFLQRQKAVAVGAVVDEGSFERGLQTRDAALVDVGLLLDAIAVFDVEVIQLLAIDEGDAQLLFLSCVNEHSFHSYRFPLAVLAGRKPG
jgi:hypothetical protein